MVFCSLIASSAIRAFISALKLRRCLDFISAPFPRQRFYTLLTGPNFGEHLRPWMCERIQCGRILGAAMQRRNTESGEYNQASYASILRCHILDAAKPSRHRLSDRRLTEL